MSGEEGHVNQAFCDSEGSSKHLDDGSYEEIDLSDKTPEDAPSVVAEPQETREGRCGWWIFKPDFLQRCRTPKWVLFWLCWGGALQGMVVNGFVNVVITTIERRFGLRSSQTGLIAGGYDMASFLCLVPVSFLGGRRGASKPRWLGAGLLLMGVGTVLFALPHFTVGPYRAAGSDLAVCYSNVTEAACGSAAEGENLSTYMWVFLASQLLHGAGASPLYTLGVTYLDESVSTKMSSVYLGIFYTMAIIGPAAGYLMGGEFLKIYADALIVDPSELGLTPNSNVWVGAWWIGFLLSGLLCFIVSIPMLAFPASLPGSAALRSQKVSEAHGAAPREAFHKVAELPRALRHLLANPPFFFLNLAGASEGLIIAGFAAFLPKLIENQFSVGASLAALLVGAVTVPAGGGGTFLGGYLVKRLQLHCSGILRLCILATLGAIAFTACFFLSCPNLHYAGVTAPYPGDSSQQFSLESSCNTDCGCSRQQFDPICGINNVMYYSPCYAGCQTVTSLHDMNVYLDCSCITEKGSNISELLSLTSSTNQLYQAKNTMCETSCGYLWPFLALVFFSMVFTFMATMPALSATLRCVQEDQRSFALGIQWIKVRLLGTIPAPIIFGALIDETCILWQESCDEKGACLVYDNMFMGRYMLAIAFIAKAASLLFFFLAWWFYVPPSGQTEALEGGETPTSPDQDADSKLPNLSRNGHVNHA